MQWRIRFELYLEVILGTDEKPPNQERLYFFFCWRIISPRVNTLSLPRLISWCVLHHHDTARIDEGTRCVGGVAIKQKNTVLALPFVSGMHLKLLQPLQRDRIVGVVRVFIVDQLGSIW